MTNLRVEDGAIFEDDRQICNAEIAIENVYFSQNMRPAAARVVVRMPGMDEGAFVLDLEHLTFSALRQRMPLLRCEGPKDRQLLDAFLVEELQKKITYDAKNGRKPVIPLEPSGIQQVGEHYTAVVGGQVIANELDYEVVVKQDRWKVPEPPAEHAARIYGVYEKRTCTGIADSSLRRNKHGAIDYPRKRDRFSGTAVCFRTAGCRKNHLGQEIGGICEKSRDKS